MASSVTVVTLPPPDDVRASTATVHVARHTQFVATEASLPYAFGIADTDFRVQHTSVSGGADTAPGNGKVPQASAQVGFVDPTSKALVDYLIVSEDFS